VDALVWPIVGGRNVDHGVMPTNPPKWVLEDNSAPQNW
jgi:hypothetical protein